MNECTLSAALSLTCLASSLFAAPSTLLGAAANDARPNIILILADDMGFSDLGCYGSEIRTPNLDRLADGGLRFTQFYNLPRCWPTRAALMTGLYSHRTGIEKTKDLSGDSVTIAQVLQSAGYRTAMAGKWHLTPDSADKHNWPRQRGFDKFHGIIGGAASYYDPTPLIRDNEPAASNGENFYLTNAISDSAATYVRELASGPAPFFLYVAYTAPHWPLHAPAEDVKRYEAGYRSGWDEVRQARHRRQIELGIVSAEWSLPPRERTVSTWNDAPNKDWEARRMAVYAAQIDLMDRGIGKIIAALQEAGADKNTLVLFLADNGACAENLGPGMGNPPAKSPRGGPMRTGNSPAISPGGDDTFASYGPAWANVSNTPFRLYKHWVHEGGISTPLVVSWPARVKRGITAQPGHVIDIMATCLEVTGAKYPPRYRDRPIMSLDGKSLLPIFRGEVRTGHDQLYWEHEGNRAVRQGKWKLVFAHQRAGRPISMHSNLSVGGVGAGQWELYNLETDRTEVNNLAASQPELVRDLATKYQSWARSVGLNSD